MNTLYVKLFQTLIPHSLKQGFQKCCTIFLAVLCYFKLEKKLFLSILNNTALFKGMENVKFYKLVWKKKDRAAIVSEPACPLIYIIQ